MDKQELIDKAVKKLKGIWHSGASYLLTTQPNWKAINRSLIGSFEFVTESMTKVDGGNSAYSLSDGYWMVLCSKGDFEKRARELGWVNGYQYGIEYPANGNKPDLDGDVLVEQFSTADDKWHAGSVYFWNWNANSIKKFRIVDERYKPKDHPAQPHDMVDNSWHERGELPPVGAECEVSVLDQGYFDFEVRGYYQGKVWMASAETGDITEMVNHCKFRPIKSERERFIDAATSVFYNGSHCERMAAALFDAGFRAPSDKG